MTTTIRARMKGGIIEPLDRVDLPEGQDMMITILIPPSTADREAFRHSAEGGRARFFRWFPLLDRKTSICISKIESWRSLGTQSVPIFLLGLVFDQVSSIARKPTETYTALGASDSYQKRENPSSAQ